MATLSEPAARLASAQHGTISREQLRELGAGDAYIDQLLATACVEPAHRGVYLVTGAPKTWHQSLMAACLAGGPHAVASHRAAARLWGLLREAPVEITVVRHRAPRLDGAVVHRSTDLHPDHTAVREGIPLTDPFRLMVDLGAVSPPWIVSDVLERGLVARLFDVSAVEWMLNDLGRRGRSGAGVIRGILDERALGAARPDGLLEPRMARLLRDAELPMPQFQVEIFDRQSLVARVDFAYTDELLAIEVDGYEVHGTADALQRDLRRQNRLVELGWRVLRFTWHDVVRRPAAVASEIRRVLGNVRRL